MHTVSLYLLTSGLARWCRQDFSCWHQASEEGLGGRFRYKDSPSSAQHRHAQMILRITGSQLKYFLPRTIKKVRIMITDVDSLRKWPCFKSSNVYKERTGCHTGSALEPEAVQPAETHGETRRQVPLSVFQDVTPMAVPFRIAPTCTSLVNEICILPVHSCPWSFSLFFTKAIDRKYK